MIFFGNITYRSLQCDLFGCIFAQYRYFLRVTIVRRLTDTIKELELAVHTLSSYPDINSSIKMEVGIEDCLHIEFEYNKSKYHLKDVIVGKIYFLLVRLNTSQATKISVPKLTSVIINAIGAKVIAVVCV